MTTSAWALNTTNTTTTPLPPPGACVPSADNVHETVRHYCLLGLSPVILATNAAVLHVLCRHPQWRRPDLLLIASLCAADLLVGLSAVAALVTRARDPDVHVCLARVGLGFSAVLASILSLLAVAGDRLLAMVRPLAYPRLVTAPRALGAVGVLWGGALGAGLLPLLGWNLGEGAYSGYCSFLLALPASFVLAAFLLALLPLLAVLLIHAVLYRQARAHIRRIEALERVLGRKGRGALGMSGRSWRAVRAVSTVAGAVLACWCPFLLGSVYTLLTPRAPCLLHEVVGTHLLSLGYANSALNPALYALRNREVRALAALVLASRSCRPAPLPDVTARST